MKPRRVAGAIFGRSAPRPNLGRALADRPRLSRPKGTGAPAPTGLALALLLTVAAFLVLTAAPAFAKQTHLHSGSIGAGELSLGEHSGVAVNHTSHDVYVADTGNGRIAEFEADGTFVRGFGSLTAPTYIAIDNSGGTSSGDVYVADTATGAVSKFEAGGAPVAAWGTGGELTGFGEIKGIAVGPGGDLFVLGLGSTVSRFDSAASPVGSPFEAPRESGLAGLAIDTEGNLYKVAGSPQVQKFGPAGEDLSHELDAREDAVAVGIDPSNNDLYVAQSSEGTPFLNRFVVNCGELCNPVESFGSGELTSPAGIGIDGTDHSVYVASSSSSTIEVFKLVTLPDVTTGAATNPGNQEAVLNGEVNPSGLSVESCAFQYGPTAAYGTTVACSALPGAGTEPVPVSASLAGLLPGLYHYRLVAANANGTEVGADRIFRSFSQPEISGEEIADVGDSEATALGKVNPAGFTTTYFLEYGPTTAYGSHTQPASAGAGFDPVNVQIELAGLLPATTYHARLVARSEGGEVFGADLTFTTNQTAPAAAGLPDGRAYEPVTPVATEGNASTYVPSAGQGYLSTQGEHGIFTGLPFLVGPGGEELVFPGDPSAVGGGGNAGVGRGEEYYGSHVEPGLWSTRDLQPVANLGAAYEAFSPTLTLGVLSTNTRTPIIPGNPQSLYARPTEPEGGFTPVNPDGQAGSGESFVAMNGGTPGVPAGTHYLFLAGAALLSGEGALAVELRQTVEAARAEGREPHVLYDVVNGVLHLVSVHPDGTPDVFASVGEDPTRVISNDGTRIFWTDANSEPTPENPAGGTRLFVRTEAASPSARTTQLDLPAAEAPGSANGGRYYSASSDGRQVLFTDESQLTKDSTAAPGEPDLYQADVETGALTDLTVDSHAGGHADVQGVVGVSDDASYVYFAADGALSADAEPQECGVSGCNLYLRHAGTTALVAVLGPEDNSGLVPFDREGEGGESGVWRASARNRTVQLTPSGQTLIFMSRKSLTGYPNGGLSEVFVYEAGSPSPTCISCDPTGKPPLATNFDSCHGPVGGFFPIMKNSTFANSEAPRVISDDGGRVFFDSGEPLVPQDTNGWLDVYEWERSGLGSCHTEGGCIFLISDGTNPDSSYLLGASASGDDAFIITRAQLSAQDRNDNMDVYDARVGGVSVTAASLCQGADCAVPPPAPPLFSAPASSAFAGHGNVKHHRTRQQKLKRALKRCRKKTQTQRTRCEANAKRRFAPKRTADNPTKRGSK